MSSAFDFMFSLLDEVALEGLDGITIEMLWLRLADRPDFPIPVDDNSKTFFWNILAKHKDVEIYKLSQPRKCMPIYNRFDHIDPEFGAVLESNEPIPDPYYPVVEVEDRNIRGSCSTYRTRKCISSDIRSNSNDSIMPLYHVTEKWGDSLVLVASPKLRLLSLIGTEKNPLIDLSLEEYCLLERIGRSRYLGEVTIGEGGLSSLKARFCKQLHHYRKKLTLKGLIKKQIYYLRNKKGISCYGSLFHLTRFYAQRKNKMATLMKRLSDILEGKPQNRESCTVLKKELGIKDKTFKKLICGPFQRLVRLDTIACQELYPNGSRKDWFTVNGHAKQVKVVQSLRQWDDEYDGIVDVEETNDNSGDVPSTVHFDASKIYYGVPLIQQIYSHVRDSGSGGISAVELGRKMTLPKLDIRTLLRQLLKKEHIKEVLQDRGRQKVKRYFAKVYANQNLEYSSLTEETAVAAKQDLLAHNENSAACFAKRKCDFLEESASKQRANKMAKPPITKTVERSYGKCIDSESVQGGSNTSEFQSSHEITVSKPLEQQIKLHFTEDIPRVVSVLDEPDIPPTYSSKNLLTYRKIKRFNMIVDYLKSVRVSSISDLQNFISKNEKGEGYNFKLDRKSTSRLVYSLYNCKKIKLFKVILVLENEQTNIELICDTSIQPSDSELQAAIDQAKFKFLASFKHRNTRVHANLNLDKPLQCESSQANTSTNKSPTSKETASTNTASLHPMQYPCMEYKHVRATPKFKRAKALHMFLYYLVYKHKSCSHNSDVQCVYHESMTWKRFVPPLPDHRKEGWCFLTDIYSRIPLSLFNKVINFPQGTTGLNDYLEDEEKRHYLVKFLPRNLCNSLMNNRKYLFFTNNVIRILCYMGLVSIGPQVGKQKDQVYLYVHKYASMKDTTVSPSGYIHVKADLNYDVKVYKFDQEDDVNNFWLDLNNIAFNTPLGKYSADIGKTVNFTAAGFKPELKAATDNKNFDEIVDIGKIPGDGLGAGGFDSALFLHSRRNWQNFSNIKSRKITLTFDKKPDPGLQFIQQLLQNSNTADFETSPIQGRLTQKSMPETCPRMERLTQNFLPETGPKMGRLTQNFRDKTFPTLGGLTQNSLLEISPRMEKLTQNSLLLQKDKKSATHNAVKTKTVYSNLAQALEKKEATKLITISRRKLKHRAPYYDEKDKVAMERMEKMRCAWSSQEDGFLLLCKVASSILDPFHPKQLTVSYSVVRDLLHKQFPNISTDKTSRACQRRMRNLMSNSATVNSVKVTVGEVVQDTVLLTECNQIKPPKSNKIKWDTLFSSIVNKLLNKLSLHASQRCKTIIIPDTLQNLNESFELTSLDRFTSNGTVSLFREPQSIEDIERFVLTTQVLSAMTAVSDGTQLSHFFHGIFQKYSEAFLQSVVTDLRKKGVLVEAKGSCSRDLQSSLKFGKHYKFSMNYNNEMLTKFPVRIVKESESVLDSLRSSRPGMRIELKEDSLPGHVACLLALTQTKQITLCTQIPPQIISFDSCLTKTANTNIIQSLTNTLNDEESTELSQLLIDGSTQCEALNDKNEIKNRSVLIKDIEVSGHDDTVCLDASEMRDLPISELQKFGKASRYALYLLRNEVSKQFIDKIQNVQDYIVLNPCRVFYNLETTDNFLALPDGPRFSSENSSAERKIIESQHITRNDMILSRDQISEISELLSFYIPSDAFLVNRFSVEGVGAMHAKYSTKSLQEANTIFTYIYGFSEKGVPEREIWREFRILSGELTLFQHLSILRKAYLIIRVGVIEFTYVSVYFAKDWVSEMYPKPEFFSKNTRNHDLTTSSKDQPYKSMFPFSEQEKWNCTSEVGSFTAHSENACNREAKTDSKHEVNYIQSSDLKIYSSLCATIKNEKVYFIPRTWRNPDGSLNKPVLFDLLSTILSHIISLPGTSVSKVCERFSFVLPPVQTLELIEILEKACCVYRYHCRAMRRASLFSPASTISVTESPQPDDVEHLEPCPDAVCKIAHLRNAEIQ